MKKNIYAMCLIAFFGQNLFAQSNDIEEIDLSISATRPVLPPRQHCVAVSNGWFVGAVECSYPLDMKNTMSSSGIIFPSFMYSLFKCTRYVLSILNPDFSQQIF